MLLTRKHHRTLERIFQDPVLGTIRWAAIEALLLAVGATITEGAGSRIRVNFGPFLSVYHRPHPRPEAVKGAVRAVRHDLIRLGVQPDRVEED